MLIWQEELITCKISHCLTMTDFMIIFQLTMTFHHHHSSYIISLAPLRGCRQGDLLSPYLFIIGVELLSLQIKSNPKIKGALVNDTESLISQYADDTFLVLDGCETSLRETLICFENFYKASGLKINTSKTRVIWVGNKRYSNQILCPDFKLNWFVSNFKLLEIDFSLDLNCINWWFPFLYEMGKCMCNKLKSYHGYCYNKFLDFWKD